MKMNYNFEFSIIINFVVKERQQRYLNLLQTPNGRKKFKLYIPHFKDLDESLIQNVSNLNSPNQLFSLLITNKAPEFCYIISENSLYDSKNLSLEIAINKLFNSGIAYFLCCIESKLYYYEGEEINSKFLLKKN